MRNPPPPLSVTGDQSELDRLCRRVAELEEMVASLSETLHQERLRLERGPVVAVSWDERAGWPVSYVSSNIDQFGYTADDFTSNRIAYLDFIHPDDRERVIAEIAHLRAGQAPPLTRIEYRVVCADGTVRCVADFSRLVYDATGKIVRVDGYLLDVTRQKDTEKALRESATLLQRVIDHSSSTVYVKDIQGRYIQVSQQVINYLRRTREQILGKTDDDLFPPEVSAGWATTDQQIVTTGNPLEFEVEIPLYDGIRTFIAVKFPIFNEQGDIYAIGGIATDITEHIQVEAALRASEAKFRSIVEQSSDGISLTDEHGLLIEWSPGMEQITGLSRSAVIGQPVWEIQYRMLPADQQTPAIYAQLQASVQMAVKTGAASWLNRLVEQYLQRPDGRRWCAQQHAFPIQFNGGFLICAIVRDIIERKQMEQQLQLANAHLQQQAIRDALTGLHNRRYLDEALPREVQRAARHQQLVSVIMLDIDHFKRFNDTYGHDAGDTLLRAVGSFLQAHTRGEDITCRYGGEEFTLVLPGAALDHARQRAEQVRVGVQNLSVFHCGNPLESVTVSLGIAVFPEHGTTADVLMQAADRALYQAKQSGRNCVVEAQGEVNSSSC
ncbi:MAG: diguanylate cyclase [Chloroflexaceae bacterium]